MSLTHMIFALVIFIVLIIPLAVQGLKEKLRIPFEYPVIIIKIDISGRRRVSYEDCIDQWIIDNRDYSFRESFINRLSEWDRFCKEYIERSAFRKEYKEKLYHEMRHEIISNDYKAFQFDFVRLYRCGYKLNTIKMSLSELLAINNELKEIDFATTREKYNANNQRKLMTKELRHKIMERDNYTCQMCGKYMPDEVGLHIDHIIAIKNGGKTLEGNLQVLCDKCNLSKGSKA